MGVLHWWICPWEAKTAYSDERTASNNIRRCCLPYTFYCSRPSTCHISNRIIAVHQTLYSYGFTDDIKHRKVTMYSVRVTRWCRVLPAVQVIDVLGVLINNWVYLQVLDLQTEVTYAVICQGKWHFVWGHRGDTGVIQANTSQMIVSVQQYPIQLVISMLRWWISHFIYGTIIVRDH